MLSILGVSTFFSLPWIRPDLIAIWTGLSRNLDADSEEAIRKTSPFWKSRDQGAATVLVAALDPALNGGYQSMPPRRPP